MYKNRTHNPTTYTASWGHQLGAPAGNWGHHQLGAPAENWGHHQLGAPAGNWSHHQLGAPAGNWGHHQLGAPAGNWGHHQLGAPAGNWGHHQLGAPAGNWCHHQLGAPAGNWGHHQLGAPAGNWGHHQLGAPAGNWGHHQLGAPAGNWGHQSGAPVGGSLQTSGSSELDVLYVRHSATANVRTNGIIKTVYVHFKSPEASRFMYDKEFLQEVSNNLNLSINPSSFDENQMVIVVTGIFGERIRAQKKLCELVGEATWPSLQVQVQLTQSLVLPETKITDNYRYKKQTMKALIKHFGLQGEFLPNIGVVNISGKFGSVALFQYHVHLLEQDAICKNFVFKLNQKKGST